MEKTRSTTASRTVEITEKREIAKALRKVELTREEELVLRMRHGIGEAKSTPLEFRGQHDPEVAAKLAMIEADLLAAMRPQTSDEDLSGTALKAAIIERLKRL